MARIIDEYELDARERLAAEAALTAVDREWLTARSASTLSAVATGTLRLVALREAGSVNAAAERLGMSHTSLLRWLGRRQLFAATAKRRGR
jgi:molybdenum-dependent DNA-binding transcriptional regulator ModE